MHSTSGTSFIVDDEDYERVSVYNWHFDGRYLYRGSKPNISLHVFLMGKAPKGYVWDHIDRDTTNNRKSNLRLATLTQNRANMNKFVGKYTSRYKGVTWDERTRKWLAQIMVNYKNKNLGRFSSEEEAARAYDNAAKEYFGEYARCNFD